MRIAVDVMGGDHGSRVVIDGVKQALADCAQITELHLVGQQAEIEAALEQAGCGDARLRIVHASEVIAMEDKPLDAVRRKKDCSMVRAMELVRDGKAEAVISPGNTGALVASATLKLRRLEGIERPAIACIMPAGEVGDCFLLDGGANPECKPLHLAQFAVMGSVYSRELLKHAKPRVGVLSNGTEESKGTDLTRDAARLCAQLDLNFIGYVEGHDLFEGNVDVVVTDGFTGNIVLKSIESLGHAVLGLLRRELSASPVRKLGALFASGAFRDIKRRMDPEAYGGAPILGLNGVVIKAHGSARAKAFRNAIRVASETIQFKINESIAREVRAATERLAQSAVHSASPAVA
ncbi:MAG TPA: phosphate acyltransferase PlsX [Verrucomicrobiae bacterium]|nr:phosphate acyltransferase PlsX [Verrucomicrobiae bacterium]